MPLARWLRDWRCQDHPRLPAVGAARHSYGRAGWRGGSEGEPELLASCYRHSLQVAAANGVRTIAFPAISTGAYGYPLEQATAIAAAETRASLKSGDAIDAVTFACFSEEALAVYQKALAS